MARNPDLKAGRFETEDTGGGVLSGLLAEEDVFDRHSLWRLGSWGAASVGAVVVAVLANQSSIGARREQVAADDLTRQAQQVQSIAKESQNETRRLASAIDTLNGDRDRLYSRVTVLEQGLDSVTGALARQKPAAASAQAPPPPQAAATTQTPSTPQAAATPQASGTPQAAAAAQAAATQAVATSTAPPLAQNPAPPPAVSPVATTDAATAEKPQAEAKPAEQTPATVSSIAKTTPGTPAPTPSVPLMGPKSMMAPPDVAAGKLIEPDKSAMTATALPAPEEIASTSPEEVEPSEATPARVQRTEFAVDLGGANSIGGLRALWRGLLKSNAALSTLRPIIMVKEGNTGHGLQLRLAAGPLGDAAAAAKICAVLVENKRPCETTVFDGQRLAMNANEPPITAAIPPPARKRAVSKRVGHDDAAKKPDSPSTFSSLFGKR
jgi:hypothetical protein